MTSIEMLLLNQKNHTNALILVAGLLQNSMMRQEKMLMSFNDPIADYVKTDLTILNHLLLQLGEMKIRNQ